MSLRRGVSGLAVALAATLLSGCGGGGSSTPPPTGQLIAQQRAVPETVAVAGSQALRLLGGDDYLMILSQAGGYSGTVTVQVNGGDQELPLLAARSREASDGRHTPIATWRGLSLQPQAGRQTAETDPALGSQRKFYVVLGPSPSVHATLRAKGPHSLLYVDNNTPSNALSSADIEDLRDQFDNHIYATDTRLFGATGDVDGNGRVIIVLTPTVPVGSYGYFYPADLLGSSNNADMLYALVPRPNSGLPYSKLRTGLLATMAHELQHLINFHHKRSLDGEESWLNEGLSFVAEQFNGYLDSVGGSPENVAAWFRSPERYTARELTGAYKDGHAGIDYLLVRYLVDRYGQGVLSTLVSSNLVGLENVAAVAGQSFDALFCDLGATLYLAGTNLTTNPRYALPGFDTRTNYPVENVTLNGPRYTRVPSGNGQPRFMATWAQGGLRYLRLTGLPSGGARLALTTNGGAAVRATFIRIPADAP